MVFVFDMKMKIFRVLSDIVKRRFVLPPGLLHASLERRKRQLLTGLLQGEPRSKLVLKLSGSCSLTLACPGLVGVDRESDQVP